MPRRDSCGAQRSRVVACTVSPLWRFLSEQRNCLPRAARPPPCSTSVHRPFRVAKKKANKDEKTLSVFVPTAVFCPCSLSCRMTPSVAALAAAVGTLPLAALAAAAAGSAGRERMWASSEAARPRQGIRLGVGHA